MPVEAKLMQAWQDRPRNQEHASKCANLALLEQNLKNKRSAALCGVLAQVKTIENYPLKNSLSGVSSRAISQAK